MNKMDHKGLEQMGMVGAWLRKVPQGQTPRLLQLADMFKGRAQFERYEGYETFGSPNREECSLFGNQEEDCKRIPAQWKIQTP